jgi:hypothetical protein
MAASRVATSVVHHMNVSTTTTNRISDSIADLRNPLNPPVRNLHFTLQLVKDGCVCLGTSFFGRVPRESTFPLVPTGLLHMITFLARTIILD